ncbi:hypothetical protein E2C01_007801 [Portunus trituberculatus]|uniref:Uncharacterized protein n=1 Tax=Portunus trituberculatus TaxID=210409 RepID=A0A5B7CZZ4_PORTR|nr:hypothetical protein [Portunus trituberculatus]
MISQTLTNSSGGPSSASSALCSSPILLRSHTCSLRSVPELAKMVSFCLFPELLHNTEEKNK